MFYDLFWFVERGSNFQTRFGSTLTSYMQVSPSGHDDGEE